MQILTSRFPTFVITKYTDMDPGRRPYSMGNGYHKLNKDAAYLIVATGAYEK